MRYAAAASAAGLLICLAACAQAPEQIEPSYVSSVPYETWSCQQLGEETVRLNQALATASQTQDQTRSNDTAGVILLGLPVASMSGGNIAPQIASLKGQQDAVRQMMISKNCPAVPPPPAPTKKT